MPHFIFIGHYAIVEVLTIHAYVWNLDSHAFYISILNYYVAGEGVLQARKSRPVSPGFGGRIQFMYTYF